jgi:carboxylesterase
MENLNIMAGAKPFFYPGNDTGCLVVHGLTGTPSEVRWLGQHLHAQGYTVHGPRLAGHATTFDDLSRVTWREWYFSALSGYELLRAQCQRVFVLGLSMGGVLSLTLAAREPVAGLVAMSTPNRLDDWRVRLLMPLLSRVISALPKAGDPLPIEEDPFQQEVIAEQRRRGEDPIGHPSYHDWSVCGLVELNRLLAVMRAGLPNVTAPALLIHARNDNVVPFDNLQLNFDALGSAYKQCLIIDESDHVLTEDEERDRVFQAAADFIAAHG